MNLHLRSDCVRDYGPFWLFAYERFNGKLGSYHTNNRNISVQLTRPAEFRSDFLPLIEHFKSCLIWCCIRNNPLNVSMKYTMNPQLLIDFQFGWWLWNGTHARRGMVTHHKCGHAQHDTLFQWTSSCLHQGHSKLCNIIYGCTPVIIATPIECNC